VARVSIYLNFQGQTEEAFGFYAAAFGTQVTALQRFRDVPPSPDAAPLPEADLDKVMHAELSILAGTVLMGTDMLESLGQHTRIGNNTTINLEPDGPQEAQRLYEALSSGATESVPLQEMFWGAWWGVCLDRYGIRWMFNAPVDPATAPPQG
jgi:PhnB protein